MTNLPQLQIQLSGDRYARSSVLGRKVRPVLSEGAKESLLRGPLAHVGLRAGPIQSEPSSLPCFLLSIGVTERPSGLRALLESVCASRERSVLRDWLRTSRGLSVLVVENSLSGAAREQHKNICQEAQRHGLRVHLYDDGIYGRSIGKNRQAQVLAAVGMMREEGHLPDIVWMLDDDLSLERLCVTTKGSQSLRDVDYFAELACIWREHPEVSLGIGGVSGAPPIRPEAILRTHLFDLLATLEWVSHLGPQAVYRLPVSAPARRVMDFYYDHSERSTQHLFMPFVWQGSGRELTTQEELFLYLKMLPSIFKGEPCTRPLLDAFDTTIQLDPHPQRSPLRGGNAVFFDLDAFLFHPYPEADLGAGIFSRRADMIGASLLARAPGYSVHNLGFTLRHSREEQHPSNPSSLLAEIAGVALARKVLDGKEEEIGVLCQKRVLLLQEHTHSSKLLVSYARSKIDASSLWPWSDPTVREHLNSFLGRVDERLYEQNGLLVSWDRFWNKQGADALQKSLHSTEFDFESYARIISETLRNAR